VTELPDPSAILPWKSMFTEFSTSSSFQVLAGAGENPLQLQHLAPGEAFFTQSATDWISIWNARAE
jgi:hypothetical protein